MMGRRSALIFCLPMCAVEEVLQLSSLMSYRPVRSGWRFCVTSSPIGNPPAFQIPRRDPKLYLISLSHCPLKLSKDPNGCRCFVLFHENLDSPSGRVLRRPYRRIWGPVANFTPKTHVGLVRLPQYLYYRCNGSVAAIPRARNPFRHGSSETMVACPVLISFAPGAALCLLVVSLARPQNERSLGRDILSFITAMERQEHTADRQRMIEKDLAVLSETLPLSWKRHTGQLPAAAVNITSSKVLYRWHLALGRPRGRIEIVKHFKDEGCP
ncbi:hypothetical protein BJ166DRAFT_133546 [Pestalotiopsis sp. NC0098]|nr:hypothetical protein BJ166DRAFT_133546 [Pestalotiopsis sp. NC0098]